MMLLGNSSLFRALFLAGLLAGTAGAGTPSPALVVAAEDDADPWSKADGTGFANEVVRAAFHAVGTEIELRVVPYNRGKDMAVKGKAVACFSMSWSSELSGKIVFPEQPLFVCYADYFTSRKKPLAATREAELPRGTVVGTVIGYEYPPSVIALKQRGILVLEESESEELNLKKLAEGRIDAALVNYNETKPAELLMARAGVTGQVRRAFRSGILRSYIGFSTAHPEGGKALQLFNRGYRIISGDGTRRRIEKHWRELALTEAARKDPGSSQ